MRLRAYGLVGFVVLGCFAACGSDDDQRSDRDPVAGQAGAGDAGAGNGLGGEANAAEAGASAGGNGSDAGGNGNSAAGAGGSDGSEAGAGGTGGTPPVIGPVSIDGVIVARNEQPVPGITIEVQGESVVTGVDGRFQIEAIAPYDIVVRGEELGGDVYIEAYLGVTRADPKLYRRFVDEDRSGGAQGTVSGGLGFPQPTGHQTLVTFGGPVLATFQNTLAAASNGAYTSSGNPAWLTTPTLSGQLFAIQFETATRTVTGIGSAPFTFVDGESTAGGDVAMQTPTFFDFTLNISAPSGIPVTGALVSAGLVQTRQSPGVQEIFTLPSGVPDEIGISVNVYGGDSTVGTTGATYTLPSDTVGFDIELLAPPVITAPASTVGHVAETTPLRYTRPAGTVAALNFNYETGDAETGFSTSTIVYTNEPSITLERLTDLDIGMPPGIFAWSVATESHGATIDELLAPNKDRWPLGPSSTSPQRSFLNGELLPFP